MAQVSLCLDEETKTRVRKAAKAAKAAGLTQSRWLARLVRRKTLGE